MIEYKHQPIYKYITILILFLLFFMHYESVPKQLYIHVSIVLCVFVIVIDYMIIEHHPPIVSISHTTSIVDNVSDSLSIEDLEKQIDINSTKLKKLHQYLKTKQ